MCGAVIFAAAAEGGASCTCCVEGSDEGEVIHLGVVQHVSRNSVDSFTQGGRAFTT